MIAVGKKGGGQLWNELGKAIKIREARSVRCDQHGDVQVGLATRERLMRRCTHQTMHLLR